MNTLYYFDPKLANKVSREDSKAEAKRKLKSIRQAKREAEGKRRNK